MAKILGSCPGCACEMEISQLTCTECDIVISGRFEPTRFDRLSTEDLHFAELFISLRGNIKDMERELGISYPTVRSRLNDVIRDLGFEPEDEIAEDGDKPVDHSEILAKVESGELGVEEAVILIKGSTAQ
jgi:hypothetical protein